MANTKGIGLSLPVVFDNAFKEHNLDGTHNNLCGAIKFVSTYAELKTACEDATVHKIYGLANCIGGTTIAPTSYTYIDMLGHTLDWNGAVYGYMFLNAAATHVVYENIHWERTGNGYHLSFNTASKVIACQSTYGVYFWLNGTGVLFWDCTLLSFRQFRIYSGSGHRMVNCTFGAMILTYQVSDIQWIGCRFQNTASIYMAHYSTGPENADFVFSGCHFNLTASTCVYFHHQDAPAATMRNVKFLGCTFEPSSNTRDCITVENDATFTIEDVLFDGCTFRDYNDAYLIPAAVGLARWRFNSNAYLDEAGTRYNFTDPGDFRYTQDG